MTKWLRWQGLIVFGILATILVIFWVLLIDIILKHTLEKTGTHLVGAKVELAAADLHLFPLGVTLVDLQVTNPDQPMSNALEAQEIDFSLDSLNLLRRKIIIDTMALTGVRFNTPRKTSGAVIKGPKQEPPPADKPATLKLPSFQIPDIKDILAKEKFESLELIKNLRTDIDTTKDKWRQQLKTAPDQKTFARYQKRIEELSQKTKSITGAVTAAGDIQKLQKDISRDLKRLKNMRKDFLRETDSLKSKAAQLKSAPKKDIDRILQTYSLSSTGLGNVARLLFDDKVGNSVAKAIYWYNKIKPYVERAGDKKTGDTALEPTRGKGVNIKFREEASLPDFLARQINISMTLPSGDMQGEISNVTQDQSIIGQPLKFDFSGDRLKDVQSINIIGSMDRVDPDISKDIMTVTIKQYRVNDVVLSDSDQLPISIKDGLAHLNLEANLKNNMLAADVKLTLDSVQIETGNKTDENQLQQALQSALADVSKFSVKAHVSGPLDDYKIKITSDLDQVLGDAVRKQMNTLSRSFQKKLKTGIMQKIKFPMADATGSLSGLAKIDQEIISRLNLGDDISKELVQKLGDKVKITF